MWVRIMADEAKRRQALVAVATGGAAAVVAAAILVAATEAAAPFAVAALVLYGAVATLVVAKADVVFGWANGVTLVRLVITSLFAGLACQQSWASPLSPELLWLFLGLALVALLLDGLDGRLARRLGTASAFGARFDMEVDALLILLLSLLAWLLGKAGPWILVLGLMRYLFVAAGLLWPALTAPLPPSFRRQAVCVIAALALAALLAPPLVPPLSVVIAALGLALICGSFAIDTIWLLRHHRPA